MQSALTSPAAIECPLAPDYVDVRVLAAGVAERHTVPATATSVIFSATGEFYVRWDAAQNAAVPAADVTDGSGSERSPDKRQLRGLASFSLIAPAATTVTMSFYKYL